VLGSGALLAARVEAQGRAPAAEHPASWGDSHVGEPLPTLVESDDCLFCHRRDIGPIWPDDVHRQSVRVLDSDSELSRFVRSRFAAVGQGFEGISAVMGGERMLHFLRPNDQPGQFSMLSAAVVPGGDRPGQLVRTEGARWQGSLFGRRCAGCHSTAVETSSMAFSAPSIECYSCHGAVDGSHAADPASALLAEANKTPARVVASICGQCHIRSGVSATTGRPYANHFVPGDNLFRDLAVNFSDEALAAKNPIDRHVLHNIRSIVIYGEENITCLTCHSTHSPSLVGRHAGLQANAMCDICHDRSGDRWSLFEFEVSSDHCEYGSEWLAAEAVRAAAAELRRRELEAEQLQAFLEFFQVSTDVGEGEGEEDVAAEAEDVAVGQDLPEVEEAPEVQEAEEPPNDR